MKRKWSKREQAFREAFFIKHGYFPKSVPDKKLRRGPRLLFGMNTVSR